MSITKEEVQIYLDDVKSAVKGKRCKISAREVNDQLFEEYLIDEEGAGVIILSLCVEDFCKTAPNEDPRYPHELLYIFGKDVNLIPRFGGKETTVSLYIKFNKLDNHYTIVVSFHKQKYPLKYKFK
ncbi:MAG: hypothetical protein IKW01_02610 [Firmicutes bacterium]|nr:hypothetical protein [Bacillota bacterium]